MRQLDGNDPASVGAAAAALAAGELVALPTETVYGLGARADDDAAVACIFAAKGRPREHPLIVHVADLAAARVFAQAWPPAAQCLVQAFWPGPLTLIVPRTPGLAAACAGGQDTIGLRCPAHPLTHAVLVRAQQLGVPGVAAPSANRFGRLSPTRAAHVQAEFAEAVPQLMVLDGGDCRVGIESTIVDLSQGRPVLLRPGALTRAQIEAVLGEALGAPGAHAPRAPGTLQAHYAPRARLRLMSAEQLRSALEVIQATGKASALRLAVYSRTVVPGGGLRHRPMPAQADAAAHQLFGVLRELDDEGAQLIWVETPPDTLEWEGVRDRLQRAAAA